MNKKEKDIVDKFIKKLSKLNGDLVKNALTGAHEIWIKKADAINVLNEMIKELKKEQ